MNNAGRFRGGAGMSWTVPFPHFLTVDACAGQYAEHLPLDYAGRSAFRGAYIIQELSGYIQRIMRRIIRASSGPSISGCTALLELTDH